MTDTQHNEGVEAQSVVADCCFHFGHCLSSIIILIKGFWVQTLLALPFITLGKVTAETLGCVYLFII